MTLGDRHSTWLGFATLYVALTVAYAWPLIAAISTALPNDIGDPGLNAWILWWNSKAIPFTDHWWNAPIFFPSQGSFALSETLLSLTIVTTPLQWLGASPVTAYNIAFLVSFPVTALAAHALAYRLTGRHDAALVAGLAFGFSPYRASQIPHIQMQWAMWMPLCLLALHRYLDTRRVSALVVAGLLWVLNGLTSGYFLVFFAVLTGIWMLWFARTRRDWIAIGLTLTLASLVLAPALIGYRHHQQALGLSRDFDEIMSFSADLTGFWAASPTVWLPRHWTVEPLAEGELYPGVTILLLTLVGAIVAWRQSCTGPWRVAQVVLGVAGVAVAVAALVSWNGGWKFSLLGMQVSLTRPGKAMFTAACLLVGAVLIDHRMISGWRRRSPLIFYSVAAVVMMLFALGPIGHVFGTKFLYQAPYSWLMLLPGGHALRVPARFTMLFVLCLSQAAAVGFCRLTPRGSSKALLIPVCLAILADGWMPRFPVAAISPTDAINGSIDRQTPLLELPMQDVFTESAAMLRATRHEHPLINGFSGYAPAHYDAMQNALNSKDSSVLEALRQFGPLLVVIDRTRDPDEVQTNFVRDAPDAQFVSRSALGPVYRFTGSRRRSPTAGVPLAIEYVDANSNYGVVKNMLDGDLDTFWDSAAPQTPGDQVIVVFPQPVVLSRLVLDLTARTLNYPRRLVVEVADDGQRPVKVWEGRTAGLAVLGALNDHEHAPLVVDLPETAVGRRFTLTTAETHEYAHWSIAELHAFGRLK